MRFLGTALSLHLQDPVEGSTSCPPHAGTAQLSVTVPPPLAHPAVSVSSPHLQVAPALAAPFRPLVTTLPCGRRQDRAAPAAAPGGALIGQAGRARAEPASHSCPAPPTARDNIRRPDMLSWDSNFPKILQVLVVCPIYLGEAVNDLQ